MMIFTMLALTLAQNADDEKLYPMTRVLEKMQKKIDDGIVEEAMGKKISQAFARVLARAKPRIEKGEDVDKIAVDCLGDDTEALRSSEVFKNYLRNEYFNAKKRAETGKHDHDRAKGRQNMRAIGALKKVLFPNMN